MAYGRYGNVATLGGRGGGGGGGGGSGGGGGGGGSGGGGGGGAARSSRREDAAEIALPPHPTPYRGLNVLARWLGLEDAFVEVPALPALGLTAPLRIAIIYLLVAAAVSLWLYATSPNWKDVVLRVLVGVALVAVAVWHARRSL